MSETIDPQENAEIDTIIQEMKVFYDLVEEIDTSIPDEFKEELEVVPGGKFGQKMDFENGFGQERQ